MYLKNSPLGGWGAKPFQLIVLILKELGVFLLTVIEDDILLLLRLFWFLGILNDDDFLCRSIVYLWSILLKDEAILLLWLNRSLFFRWN